MAVAAARSGLATRRAPARRCATSSRGDPVSTPAGAGDSLLLRSGERVRVRPVRSSDAAELMAMHARLTADSIYRRYFAALPRLSPSDARRLTTLDAEWRFALVATSSDGAILGIARYEGEMDGRSADLAVVVDDAVQRSGLGGGLLRRLVDVAVLQGIETLKADVLAGNRGMHRLLSSLGLPMTMEREGSVITVELDLRGIVVPPGRRDVAAAHVADAAAIRAGMPSAESTGPP
jgi:RimJ/RimL family protein N-acetyltransferase